MEINGRKLSFFEVNGYEYNGKDLVITRIGAYDTDGKWIKWVKLKNVKPYLSRYPVKFKQYE